MNTIGQLEVSGNHRQVGRKIGLHFSGAIHRLFDNYEFLQKQLLPFLNTSAGQHHYHAYLKLHRKQFPQYISELEGMAEGAGRPFEEIFAVNLRGEFRGLIALVRQTTSALSPDDQGCTDCLVLTPDSALVGHNEDGSPAGYGNMYVVRVAVENKPTFHALCYPGFLPGNALGFNEFGILHSINHVAPRHVKTGVGRHFVARSLLEARSLTEALQCVTIPGRAAGFNYNMGSLAERRILAVEVSPERYCASEVQGYYLHTNHYLELRDVVQDVSLSSRKRLERCRTLCRATTPTDSDHVLSLLSDKADGKFPIFRDATPPDDNATLCSALFDLDHRQLTVYWDNPALEPEKCIRITM